jgi:hypothetical protein
VQARAGPPFCGVLNAFGPPCLTAIVELNWNPWEMQAKQEDPTSAASHQYFKGLTLAIAVLLAYLPCLSGKFLWDDDSWTFKLKPLFASISGLRRMWTDFSALQQYYPLTGSSFWVDYQLWGLVL